MNFFYEMTLRWNGSLRSYDDPEASFITWDGHTGYYSNEQKSDYYKMMEKSKKYPTYTEQQPLPPLQTYQKILFPIFMVFILYMSWYFISNTYKLLKKYSH